MKNRKAERQGGWEVCRLEGWEDWRFLEKILTAQLVRFRVQGSRFKVGCILCET
ncbi:MAG: hypothetical protein JRD71_06550 [Deltaproteobacteria bacterium]|nr:hypothetical protein [Deltaproteobacteria bacterium]